MQPNLNSSLVLTLISTGTYIINYICYNIVNYNIYVYLLLLVMAYTI